MPQTLEGVCPSLVLDNGCKVVIEARDPTTGAAVTGVTVTNVNVYGLDLTADNTPAVLNPVFVPAGGQAV